MTIEFMGEIRVERRFDDEEMDFAGEDNREEGKKSLLAAEISIFFDLANGCRSSSGCYRSETSVEEDSCLAPFPMVGEWSPSWEVERAIFTSD